MSDFDGKPLVFRDDIEREFWGQAFVATWNQGPTGSLAFAKSRSDIADDAVIAMRVRQADSSNYPFTVCSVCGTPSGEAHPQHSEGCPKSRL